MSAIAVLADDLGPRGRRRVQIATAISAVLVIAVLVIAGRRLATAGQLTEERWRPLSQVSVIRFLLGGMANTLRAAAVAMAIALAIGAVMALGRLAQGRTIRWAAGVYVEMFRAIPLILLILFTGVGLPRYGLRWSPFWFLVMALVAYNSAVMAEIVRAGILSLDRGQREGGRAVGLTYWQTMRLILVPQAVRRMVPSLVSQSVILLKDTSLGFVIGFDELLRRSRSTGEYFHNPLQTLVVIALMYIVVNLALSRVAAWLDSRQQRRPRTAAIPAPTIPLENAL